MNNVKKSDVRSGKVYDLCLVIKYNFYTSAGFMTFATMMVIVNALKNHLPDKIKYWNDPKSAGEKRFQSEGYQKTGPKRRLGIDAELLMTFIWMKYLHSNVILLFLRPVPLAFLKFHHVYLFLLFKTSMVFLLQ